MLCYRCGSHVPEGAGKCLVCGQPLNTSANTSASAADKGRGPGPLKEGQTFADRYVIADLINIGAIGYLYRARDQDMDIDVALKVISPNLLQTDEERANFQSAAKNARKVRHPNIIRIFDSGYEEGVSYYTMPYTQGLSLEKIIALRQENNEHFSMEELFGLFAQIAAALDALVDYGPICSLKPANIIVLPDLLKVTGVPDFKGLPNFPYVAMQRKKGTLWYMSPAAKKEGSTLDIQADIYSLAIILGEMLTGIRASEKIEAFDQALASFPQHVRMAFNTVLHPDLVEDYPYNGAYDFVAAIFPEEVARQETIAEDSIQLEEEALEVEDGATVPDLASVAQAVVQDISQGIGADLLAVEATVVEAKEEELEISADELEEEEPPAPPVMPAAEPPVVLSAPQAKIVSASALMVKAEDEPPQIPVVVPTPISESQVATRVEIPVSANVMGKPIAKEAVKEKKSKGPAIAFGAILVVGGLAAGSFFMMNKQDQEIELPKMVADATSEQKVVANQTEEVAAVAEVDVPTDKSAKKIEKERPVNNKNNSRDVKESKERARSESKVDNKAEEKENAVSRDTVKTESKEVKAELKDEKSKGKNEKEVVSASNETKTVIIKEDATKERNPITPAASSNKPAQADPATENLAKKIANNSAEAGETADETKGTCPADMILVPSGTFQMGTAATDTLKDFDDMELKPRKVKAFCIDVYEYPNKEGSKPTQSLTYGQAQKHCQQKGKRLCREEEWEKACKGPNNYRYPYGNRFSATQCNVGPGGTVAAGQFARCKSAYGVFDMAGNVAEWTSSKLDADLPDRVYKGGAFGANNLSSRCAARHGGDPNSHEATVGVRCCKNPL